MSEPSPSSRLVAQAKASLDNMDAPKLAGALMSLVAAEPIRWRQLLLLAGLWPEPSPQKVKAKAGLLPQTLSCLLKAIGILLDDDGDHLETSIEVVMTLQGFTVLQAYYGDITDELNKLAFVSSPAEVQIHRLLALVESQSWTLQNKLTEIHEAAGLIDPTAGHISNVPTRYDDSKVSLGEAFDGMCESVELGLRFILHSNKLPPQPTFQPASGPYHDVEIAKFCTLAGMWRVVAEQWANMRYRDWRWTAVQGGVRGCFPADKEAYLREHAGALRYQLFMHDRVFRRVAERADHDAYFTHLQTAAASLTVPEAGERWDGRIDMEAFIRLCALNPLRVFTEEYVDHRHYLPLINGVKVGSIGWREWLSGKEALYCLADAMRRAVSDQVADSDLACMRQVVVVPEAAITSLLVACGRLTEGQSRDLLNVLRFDPKRKSLELWDQPLVPCGDGLVFLVPSLVTSGNSARAIENFVSQWEGVSFDVRGTPFEVYVVKEIHGRSTARAVGGVKIERPGESDLEFDVVMWWEGYLLLLEAKCEKAVFSPADYHRAKRQIEKSIDQLVLRRQALPNVWSALRAKAPSLGLPERYVGEERVLCVSMTNIMDFTAYTRDGVVVTDDSCFFRFFGERMVKQFVSGNRDGVDMEAIRTQVEPHPHELMRYLLNPPQMRRLLEKMRATVREVPAITERTPGFLTAHFEFDG